MGTYVYIKGYSNDKLLQFPRRRIIITAWEVYSVMGLFRILIVVTLPLRIHEATILWYVFYLNTRLYWAVILTPEG